MAAQQLEEDFCNLQFEGAQTVHTKNISQLSDGVAVSDFDIQEHQKLRETDAGDLNNNEQSASPVTRVRQKINNIMHEIGELTKESKGLYSQLVSHAR